MTPSFSAHKYDAIEAMLRRSDQLQQVADLFGIGRSTLWYRLKRLGRITRGPQLLSPQQRRIMALKAKGMDRQEIAFTVGTTLANVSTQMCKARGKMGAMKR